MYQRENLLKMNLKGHNAIGMDVVIVSTRNAQLASFWQTRLEQMRGEIIKPQAYVIAVDEDWSGGIGNGLSSLYSFQKARQKGESLYGIQLDRLLANGASIALYHTGDQGKRLYPLVASEYHDQSAIKLPGLIHSQFMTLLEGMIKQTAIYAPYRKGRLSVFWGDQLFIPSNRIEYPPLHHVDILAQSRPFPSEQEWKEKGWSQYALIGRHEGESRVVNKSEYHTIQRLIDSRKFPIDEGLAMSLGSFSLSASMTFALLEEFAPDLELKERKLDSELALWMPLTLDLSSYMSFISKSTLPSSTAAAHHDRLQRFKRNFLQKEKNQHLLGISDIGTNSYWWNYGTNRAYFENNLKLTYDGEESDLMRLFFHTPLYWDLNKSSRFHKSSSSSPEFIYQNPISSSELKVDNHSCLLNCQIRSGRVINSVLIDVCADHIEVDHCVIINSSAARIYNRHALFYNVLEDGDLSMPPNSVRTDCLLPQQDKIIKMQTTLQRDGREDWTVRLPGNPYSYEELSKMNTPIDLNEARQRAVEAKKRLSQYIRQRAIY